MSGLTTEIERRLRIAYTRIAAGDDLPPGVRLRLEGMLEAAVVAGVSDVLTLQTLADRIHREVCGESFAARYGDDWQALFPFPEFPAWQDRAPVTPSTPD